MLRALTERGIVPDIVLGCSVGALNGAGYCMDPTMEGVEQIEEHWRRTTSADLMPSSRIPSAVQLLRKGASLHDNSGLRDGLERLLGPGCRFEDLQLAFQCVATDVEAAVARWFDEGDLVTAILASTALPGVYPPVIIDAEAFIDGGVVDNVPLGRAVELGCRTIYVLHVGPHGRPDAEIRRPLDGLRQAYWIARNSGFARDLADLPEKVEAVVLPPGERPDLKYDDFSQTEELIAQGHRNAASFLDERAAEAEGRRRGGDLFAPIERLVLSARGRSVRQAQKAATAPGGAIVTWDSLDPAPGADAPDQPEHGERRDGKGKQADAKQDAAKQDGGKQDGAEQSADGRGGVPDDAGTQHDGSERHPSKGVRESARASAGNADRAADAED